MAYKITIRSLGRNSSDYVQAHVPDEFLFQLEHEWENPFAVDTNAVVQAAAQFATRGRSAAVFDPSVVGDAVGMETFAYRGSSPAQVSLELEFAIDGDMDRDLRAPVKRLVRMSCPRPAATRTLSTLGVPDMVQVSVPGVMDIRKAFILSVGVNMMKPLVTDGVSTLPARVRVPITLASAYITTTERLEYTLFP